MDIASMFSVLFEKLFYVGPIIVQKRVSGCLLWIINPSRINLFPSFSVSTNSQFENAGGDQVFHFRRKFA